MSEEVFVFTRALYQDYPTPPEPNLAPEVLKIKTVYFASGTNRATTEQSYNLVECLQDVPRTTRIQDLQISAKYDWYNGNYATKISIFSETSEVNPNYAIEKARFDQQTAEYPAKLAAYNEYSLTMAAKTSLYDAVKAYQQLRDLPTRTRGQAIMMGKYRSKANKLIAELNIPHKLDNFRLE